MTASERVAMPSIPFLMTKPRMMGMGEILEGMKMAGRRFDDPPSIMVVFWVGSFELKDSAVRVTDLLSVRFSKYVPDRTMIVSPVLAASMAAWMVGKYPERSARMP